jgi:hypothetical protein
VFFFQYGKFFFGFEEKRCERAFFWDEKIPRRGKGAGLRGEDVWGVWGGNENSA